MKTINNKPLPQGDVLIVPITDGVPSSAVEEPRTGGALVVTHSETGHHHTIGDPDVMMFREPTDPLIGYLQVDGEFADLIHGRSFDRHETVRLPRGTYRIHRQREHTPEGWRRVQD